MKRRIRMAGVLLLLMLILIGCSKNDKSAQRISLEQLAETSEKSETASEMISETASETETIVETEEDMIDLTKMSGDMVYATVYMMMAYPKQYEGKIVRMEGIYYPAYYQKGERYCQYCIIRDALACCAQGMEFIWGDGTHQYPDEYPDENSEIEVEGIFETYEEDGDDSLHVRLKDAKLTVLSETY